VWGAVHFELGFLNVISFRAKFSKGRAKTEKVLTLIAESEAFILQIISYS